MKIQDKVTKYLEQKPSLRDDDRKLIATIWWNEIGSDKRYWTAMQLLDSFCSKELTSPESIRRCRQRVQQLNPQLRGNKYSDRHQSQKKWVNEVKAINPVKTQETLF